MMKLILAWTIPAAIAAWGSYYFSLRDPRSTSLVKIAFAGVPLVVLLAFGAVLAVVNWNPGIVGEGLLAHTLGLLFFWLFWPMIMLGAPLCVGSILGTAIGMYRSRDR